MLWKPFTWMCVKCLPQSASLNMGSVLAAASPSPAPAAAGGGQGVPGLLSVPPGFSMLSVPSVPQTSGSGQEAADSGSPLPNPGTYEECHRKCKGKEVIWTTWWAFHWIRLMYFILLVFSTFEQKPRYCHLEMGFAWCWDCCSRGVPFADGGGAVSCE